MWYQQPTAHLPGLRGVDWEAPDTSLGRNGPSTVRPGGPAETPLVAAEQTLFEGHVEFQENQRGVSFDKLLVPYLKGARQITITDPYVRQFHQARNLMELIEGIAATKDAADEVDVKLITSESTEGEDKLRRQLEFLLKIKQGAAGGDINFDVARARRHDPRPVSRHRYRLEDSSRPRSRHLPVRHWRRVRPHDKALGVPPGQSISA